MSKFNVVYGENGIVDVDATMMLAKKIANEVKDEQEKEASGLAALYDEPVAMVLTTTKGKNVVMGAVIHATMTLMNLQGVEYDIAQRHKSNIEKYIKFNNGSKFSIKRGMNGGVSLID